MYSDSLPDPDAVARAILAREARLLDNLARAIETCFYCGSGLRLRGYAAPQGRTVTLATCPTCDTYRLEDES